MATVTVEDVINQIGNGSFQWLSILFCGLSYASVAVQMVNFSMVIQQFSNDQPIPLNAEQQGLLNSIVLLGMMVGGLPIGPFSDKYGRRIANILCITIYLAFGVLQVFSYSLNMMLFSRFMVGVGIGGAQPMTYPTAGEVSPTSHRAFFFGLLNLAYFVCQTMTAPVALLTVDRLGWQVYMLICNIPSLLAFVGFVFYIPESPHFLMSVNKVDEAKRVLRFMAKQNRQDVKEEVFNALQSNTEIVPEQESNHTTIFQNIKQGAMEMMSIYMSPYVITSLCISYYWLVVNTGWAGLNLWLPSIFQDYGTNNLNQYLQTTICFAVQIPGAILSIFVVEWMGRKTIIVGFTVVSGIVLVCALINPNNGILVLTTISISLSVIAIVVNAMTLITIELYPTKMRGMVCGVASFVGYLGMFIYTFLIPSLLLYNKILVILIPILCFISSGLVAIPLKETKGKQLFEEQENDIQYDTIKDPLLQP